MATTVTRTEPVDGELVGLLDDTEFTSNENPDIKVPTHRAAVMLETLVNEGP